ncbi:hypothetical protein ACFW53_20640 [Nocardiopsis dassonvillei]|uniref:hypothetical protein n=1 Tax=Nocardiopsis dassonvillei TaxID=2014 RepID=UPI00366C3F7B
MSLSEIERRPMVLRPPRSPMPDFDAEPPVRRLRAEAAPVATQAHEVHLLIRYAAEFDQEDEVLAALTDRLEAEALLRVHEDLAAAPSGYAIRTVPIHTSAAAALGLTVAET